MSRRASTHAGVGRLAVGALVVAIAGPGCFSRDHSSMEWLLLQPITATKHEKIAARYREQAAEARMLAATHLTMATRYRAWEGAPPSGPSGQRMEEHCRRLAADFEDAAARYEALAASHAALARDRKDTPGRDQREDRRL